MTDNDDNVFDNYPLDSTSKPKTDTSSEAYARYLLEKGFLAKELFQENSLIKKINEIKKNDN